MSNDTRKTSRQSSRADSTRPALSDPVRLTTISRPSIAHFFYVLDVYRYVLLCLLFGSMSIIIGGAMFCLAMMIRLKTSSTQVVESVPLYLPGLILICNGVSMVAFISKNTRRFYLLKCVCILYLAVALMLIVVTVTTAVIYLPRLNSHRECVYTGRLRACTCVHNPNATSTISSKHFVMEEIESCEVVHGLLYDSLRVIFALSLISILVSVFAIMTLYQMYIHETQKLYFIKINSLRSQMSLGNTPVSGTGNAGYSTPNSNAPLDDSLGQSLSNARCLSADFSSQDLLFDQPSGAFRVSASENLSSHDRIWSSSQASNHNTPNDSCRTKRSLNAPSEVSVKHYMDKLKDKSNTIQSFFKSKIDSLKSANSSSSISIYHNHPHHHPHHHHHYHHHPHEDIMVHTVQLPDNVDMLEDFKMRSAMMTKQNMLPPHVLGTSRYSHPILIEFPKNFVSHSGLEPMGNRSASLYSSDTTTSSGEATLTSTSPNQTKMQPVSNHSNFIAVNDNSEFFTDEANLVRTSFKHDSDPSNKQKEACDRFRHDNHHNSPPGAQNRVQLESIDSLTQITDPLKQQHWSHASLFRCVDEEDASVETNGIPLTSNAPATIFNYAGNESTGRYYFVDNDTKPMEYYLINEKTNIPQRDMLENALPPNNNHHYQNSFKKAFKNYYESQNRISQRESLHSNQQLQQHQQPQYYSMQSRSAQDKPKPRGEMETIDSRMVGSYHYHQHTNYEPANLLPNANEITIEKQLVMSDEEFPAIEPPADYKNVVAFVPEVIKQGLNGSNQSIEILTNQNLVQPYQYWVQQFIDQIKQHEPVDQSRPEALSAKTFTQDEIDSAENELVEDDDDDDNEDDDDENDDGIDEDGAGDTSTSQDIADFELELDDEPVKYDDDTFNEKNDISPLPIDPPSTRAQRDIVPPTVSSAKDNNNNVNFLQLSAKANNMQYIEQTAGPSNLNLEGYTKNCFFRDDESTESTNSSLTNKTDGGGRGGDDEETESLTAEYIKPPTPFTNY